VLVAAWDSQALAERDLDALERIAAAQEEDAIERALVAAHERLDMEVAYVTTVSAASQRVTELAGAPGPLGVTTGTEAPIEQTYCARMLRGELPNVVPDTRQEPAARDLAATARVGSYVGVPITLADGSVHGTLCCASSKPRLGLGDEELAFMQVLAGSVARRIDQSRELADGITASRPAGDRS
jgi:GAF domain-containing protein